MRSLFSVLSLELKALVRSFSVPLLLVAVAAWVLAVPSIVTDDGTPEGAWRLHLMWSISGSFALILITWASAAAGSLARERQLKRLPLSLTRPVPRAFLVYGRYLAFLLTGVLALACALTTFALRHRLSPELAQPCYHSYRPVMPTPHEEALALYDKYMASSETPDEVKKLPKARVLRILESRASENYQGIPTNRLTKWTFHAPKTAQPPPIVRLRLSTPMDLRDSIHGEFLFQNWAGTVESVTQTILNVPLTNVPHAVDFPELAFRNESPTNLMLRPRQDLELLYVADGFKGNLFRAGLELTAILALVLAFALFVGAGLSRSVAIFTVISLLAVTLMAPAIVESYPDPLETNVTERIGLTITRAAQSLTQPLAVYSPVAHLAESTCIEWAEVAEALITNAVVFPILLSLLAGVILSRRD